MRVDHALPLYRGLRVAVVVPAFNEQKHIAKVVQNIPNFVDWIFVVDDSSTDGTKDAALSLDDPRCMVLSKAGRRLGVGGSIITGHKAAVGVDADVSVVMAGDNQMRPEYLPALLDSALAGNAYVKGNRFLRRGHLEGMAFSRIFMSILGGFFLWVDTGYFTPDPQNGFTVLDLRFLSYLEGVEWGFHFEDDVLTKFAKAGLAISEVPVKMSYNGKTGLSLFRFILDEVPILVRRLAA